MNKPYRQIGIVGTGRVACALGRALSAHGAQPVQIRGRSWAAAQAAVDRIGHARVADERFVPACDLIVLAVADDALDAVVAQLGERAAMAHGPVVFHVSGKNGVATLEPVRAAGAMVAAIHPAMTFTGDPDSEVRRMDGAAFAITARDDQALAQARRVVGLLGGVAVEIAEQQRALYHAALCHAANHLVTLLAGSCEALAAAGVAAPAVVLAPLVRAAMENSLREGFAALSGPLLRGDRGTIANHLEALAADCPQVLPAYRAMAGATLEMMDRQGAMVAEDLRVLLDASTLHFT